MDTQDKKRIWILLAAVLVFGGITWLAIRLFSGFAQSAALTEEKGRQIMISEIMPSNATFPADDGAYYDWVELYNSASHTADLSGWGLSDRADDIKFVSPCILHHRIILTAEAEMEGYTPWKVTQRLIDKVEVPK